MIFWVDYAPRKGWENLSPEYVAKLEYFDYRCAYCLDPLENVKSATWFCRPELFNPKACQWDHVIPNPACAECNVKKNNRLVAFWYCGSSLRIRQRPMPPKQAVMTQEQIATGLAVFEEHKLSKSGVRRSAVELALLDVPPKTRSWFARYLEWLK